jgi:hypothetical protein
MRCCWCDVRHGHHSLFTAGAHRHIALLLYQCGTAERAASTTRSQQA